MPSLHKPVLVVSGAEDRHTPLSETTRIFQAANEPKAIWLVEGVAHIDLYNFDPIDYESRISAFLAKYIKRQSYKRVGYYLNNPDRWLIGYWRQAR